MGIRHNSRKGKWAGRPCFRRAARLERLEQRLALSSTPAFVQTLISQGQVSAADLDLLENGYLNVQLYDGWQGNSVDATPDLQESGHSSVWEDSTAALQKGIDDGYENGLVVYIPAGNYKTSDTLGAFQWAQLNAAWDRKSNVIVGDPAGGTTITLADAAPKFDSLDGEGNPRPMLMFRHFVHPTESSFTKIPISHPDAATYYPGANWVNAPNEHANDGGTESFGSRSNIAFHNEVRDINFDLNGHSAAFGLYMPAAQSSSVANVSVDATGAYAGIWGLPGRNGGASGVTVIGGQFGVMAKPGGLGNISPNNEALFQTEIAGAKLYNQTGSAIISTDQSTLVVAGFHIVRSASGSAIQLASSDGSTASGSMDLMDGVIEITSGTAIDNSGGNNLYLSNVYISGGTGLVKSGSQATVTGSGVWSLIEEYAYTDQDAANGDPPYEVGDSKLRSFSVIDGIVSTTPEPITSVQAGTAAPAPWVYEQHVAGDLPSYVNSAPGVKVVTDFGATGDNSTNDRAAIQAAIDAASLEGHGEVFLPPGHYRIGGALTLHANTKLYGAGRFRTYVKWHSSWQPTTGEATMIDAAGGVDAETFLGFLTIEMRTKGNVGNTGGNSTDQTADDFDRFNAIHWKAGRNSMMFAVELTQQWKGGGSSKEQETQPHSQIKVTGTGGGRFYFVDTDQSDQADKHPDFRKYLIEGTTEPLWIYGFNLEHAETDAESEIRNAQNVRIYGLKSEEGGAFNSFTAGWGESPNVLIVDSQNIAVYGGSGIRQHISEHASTPGAFVVMGDSDGILIANAIPHKAQTAPNGEPLLYEHITGQAPVEITWPDALNVYKRGELDHTAMNRSVGSDPSLLEFERLTPSNASPDAWAVVSDVAASGGAYARFAAASPGDHIEYEADIAAGSYQLILQTAAAADSAVVQVYVDGVAAGPPVDVSGSAGAALGNFHFATDGVKTLRIEVLGKSLASTGYAVGLDSLQINALSATSLEAESLTVAATSGDSASVFAHEDASNGEYLWFGANAVDDYFDLTIDVPQAGSYMLAARVGASTGLGAFELLVDGQAVGEPQDLYAGSFAFESRELGVVGFTSSGEHTIRLRVTGKNEASSGYKLVIDALSLEPFEQPVETQEVEQYPVVVSTQAGYTPVATSSASGGGYVLYAAATDGDAIVFDAGDHAAGSYLVEYGFRSAPDSGIYQVSVNGQPVGGPIDAYSSTYVFAETFVGAVTHSGGAVEIRVEAVGTNPASTGQTMGLDWIRLTQSAGLEGDYNADGAVDQLDHGVWASTYGAQGAGLAADGNGDGRVDAADYTVWRDNFGATIAAAEAPIRYAGEAEEADAAETSPVLATQVATDPDEAGAVDAAMQWLGDPVEDAVTHRIDAGVRVRRRLAVQADTRIDFRSLAADQTPRRRPPAGRLRGGGGEFLGDDGDSARLLGRDVVFSEGAFNKSLRVSFTGGRR